ncbi:MAG: hypothetical protein AAF483_18290 [Planctomycetota bacterium]
MTALKDFYCSQCRRSLNMAKAVDENHAWCDRCRSVVVISHIRVRPWLLGALIAALGSAVFFTNFLSW